MIRIILTISLLFVSTPLFSTVKIGDIYSCKMLNSYSFSNGEVVQGTTPDFQFVILPPTHPEADWDIKIFGKHEREKENTYFISY